MAGHIANTEQAAAWNGDDGRDWIDHEDAYNASVRRHTQLLFEAVSIGSTHHVLDIGCGCGETTRIAARMADHGRALGVDLSAPMVARATERTAAEGLLNVQFEVGDAQVHPFASKTFDLALSRFGAMFFADPLVAFRNIRGALAPGGAMALLAWQGLERNPWMLTIRDALAVGRTLPGPPPGAPGPFGLADVERTREILSAAGFEQVNFADTREPVNLGGTAEAAFRFIGQQGISRGLLQGLDDAERAQALDALHRTLARHETEKGVLLESGAWLITATRLNQQ